MDKADVYNHDLATKQNQINEYAYHNKMDTLFFLQIFLCSILILCIFAYLARIDAITYALFIYIAFIILSIVILIFVVRYTYTRTVRDPNRWYLKKTKDFEPAVKREENAPSKGPWWSFFGIGDLSGIDIGGLCDSYSKQK